MRGAGDRPASAFVGRSAEAEIVRGVVENARLCESGALLLTGDAGVGKSALIQHVLADGDTRSLVLAGGGLPMGSHSVPYLGLRSALRRLPSGLRPPGFLDGGGGGRAPQEFDAWIEEVTAKTLVVLVMDDLHWVDPSTLDVLLYVLAGPRDRRLAVLATLRPGEVGEGHPLNTWLAAARRLPGFGVLELAPLGRVDAAEQIAALLGAPPHESLVEEIFARTQGNCYLTRLLVSGLDPDIRHLPASLPRDIEQAVLANWHRLSPTGREITSVLAVGGRRQSATSLAKALGDIRHVDDVAPVLREAVRLGVLDLDAADGSYWFHHPLQAEILARSVPADERRRWHEVWAAHFETGFDGLGETERVAIVAHHHFHAGHDEEAFHWSLRAATVVGVDGSLERVRLLRRALALRARLPRARESKVDLLWRLRDAAAQAASESVELDVVEELLACLDPTSDAPNVCELLVRRMLLRLSLGLSFLDVAEADEAVRVGAAAPMSWQYALALAERAHAAMWTDPVLGGTYVDEAVTAAIASGDPRPLSYASTAMAMATLSHDRSGALTWARRGLEAAIRARDSWAFVHAAMWEANAIGPMMDPVVVGHLGARRREAEQARLPAAAIAHLSTVEAMGALSLGRWETCGDLLRIGLGSEPSSVVDVRSRLVAARMAALQGRSAEALAHVGRVSELYADPSRFKMLEYDVVRGEILLAAGDTDGALATLESALETPGVVPTMGEWLIPLAVRALADKAAEARRGVGDLGEVLNRLDGLIRRFPRVVVDWGQPAGDLVEDLDWTPWYSSFVSAFELWSHAEEGRARLSPTNSLAWERAAAALDDVGMAWEAAYAAARAGESHLRGQSPDRRAAASWLRRAAAAAETMQARPVLDHVRDIARSARIDLDPVIPSTSLIKGEQFGLTRREREVLAHVLAGRTYADIAQALVVSEKTVSAHISNMLRKTGASNRFELAALARDAGATPDSVAKETR